MAVFDLGYAPSGHHSNRSGYGGTSLQEFFAAFPDDASCLAHVFRVRFGSDPTCPRCGSGGRWRRHEVQKHFFHPCGGILSPMAGVLFARTRIPLQLWFYAMLHFANSHESIAAPFLARQLGVSEPTAFRVGQRIRLHMSAIDDRQPIGGPGRMVVASLVKILRVTNKLKNVQNSAMVFLLCDETRVNSTIVNRPRQESLRSVLRDKVHPESDLVTDCYWTSKVLSNYNSGRPIATFYPKLFWDHPNLRNINHGFMQYFNLSFSDQFRGVSIDHAWLYLKEYEFRYNRRRCAANTFWDMVSSFPPLGLKECNCLKRRHLIHVKGRGGR